MGKIALINDSHAGARQDSEIVNNYFFKFWEEVFFPYIENNNIQTVLHLGDLVDRRKFINFKILKAWRTRFMDRFRSNKTDVRFIVGNHDTYHRNNSKTNAIEELFSEYPFPIYTFPRELELEGLNVALIPWINDDNYEDTLNFIHDTKAQICFGHLELAGFEMDLGNVCHTGLDRNLFNKFDMTISGHFHHKSTDGCIWYLGTQYQITWADVDDPKGFHVFDTETRKLEFIENPFKLFHNLVYDDKDPAFDIAAIDYGKYKDNYVKVAVLNRSDPFKYERFHDALNKAGPIDMTVVENYNVTITDDNEIIDAKDTVAILHGYVDKLEVHVDKARLKSELSELYIEAINREDID